MLCANFYGILIHFESYSDFWGIYFFNVSHAVSSRISSMFSKKLRILLFNFTQKFLTIYPKFFKFYGILVEFLFHNFSKIFKKMSPNFPKFHPTS